LIYEEAGIGKFSGRREVCNLSISLEALELRGGLCSFTFPAPGVAEMADASGLKICC
jgi:hypothetical protein